MEIRVLGGGNEVGASCLLVKMEGTSVLIDAGMRMHGDEIMPMLGMLDQAEGPECILVTHAHADHIGALPVVHSLYPQVPIYATPPTCDLMRIMMKDSYKIMEMRSRQSHSLPSYTEQQVDSVLNSILHFPASNRLQVGNITITNFRAGHILGAVMFLLEGGGESLLVTGDLSFKAGRTIPGAEVPHSINPDVVVMESTYGNRAHTDRNTEERRLADHVAEVVSGGGFALIPAFALGRAQEVLLILQDYMDKGLIPEFPIFVDGLVTPISRIYRDYPHFLKGPVSHRISKNGDAFLTERCRAVTPKEREMILQGKPGCIVASSGMLTGGASTWYAERLVSGEKNAIFITGYQDEESPGRKLLDLADGIEETIELNGVTYPVKCRISKYGLSAHADANEMQRFIQTMNPTYTLLVHGDDQARLKLAEILDPLHKPILVENGENYIFESRGSGKGVKGKRFKADDRNSELRKWVGSLLLYQSEGEKRYKAALCTGVHPKTQVLFCQSVKGKNVKLQKHQVAEAVMKWNGPMDEMAEEVGEVFSFNRPILEQVQWSRLPYKWLDIEAIFQILEAAGLKERLAIALALQSLSEIQKKEVQNGFAYLLNEQTTRMLANMEFDIPGAKMNPTAAISEVKELFKTMRGFLRSGIDGPGTEKERITLYFDFPDHIDMEERKNLISFVKKRTGWTSEISDSVRQDLFPGLIAELHGHPIGSISIHLAEKKVSIGLDEPAKGKEIRKVFAERTGFTLQYNNKSNMTGLSAGKDDIFRVPAGSGRMENNQAIEEAKRWAADRGITIYKTSMKQHNGEPLMEIHFISPEIAKDHEADLEELSYRTGMAVTYAKQPKQNEIIRITLENLPPEWELKKNPSIHMDKKKIALKLGQPPLPTEIAAAGEKIRQLTGYTLEA